MRVGRQLLEFERHHVCHVLTAQTGVVSVELVLEFGEGSEPVSLRLLVGEVAAPDLSDGDDSRRHRHDFSAVLLEDEDGRSLVEGVVDANRLTFGAAPDRGLVAFPHVDALLLFSSAPVVGIRQQVSNANGL